MESSWLSVCPSVCHMSIHLFLFSFPDDNSSKYQKIFTELGLCIDIVEIWFGLLMGKFFQFLTVIFPQHVLIFISR